MAEAWRGFKKDGHWDVDVNVRNFIQTNYTPYDGDESFLEGSTKQLISFGADFRSYRRKSVSMTAFWNAKQRSYPV